MKTLCATETPLQRLAAAHPERADRDDLNHIYCCIPELALCGADISALPEGDGDDANCIVCLDLEDAPCAICGATS